MAETITACKARTQLPFYNENLLNKASELNTPLVANIVSGSGSAEVVFTKAYAGQGSLKMLSTSLVDDLVVSSAEWGSTIKDTVSGNSYTFQFSVFNPTSITQKGNIGIYSGGSLICTVNFEVEEQNSWVTFYQNVVLPVSNFNILITLDSDEAEVVYSQLYIDGLKLESADKGVTEPSMYSGYETRVYESTANLDFPSVSNNSKTELTATLTGAEVGDILTFSYDSPLTTSGLIITAFVSAANTVKIVAFNSTGGSSDPATTVFNFRIVK